MPVLIKRYANRKLYNTETSRYITLKGIAELLENGQEVRVVDNETGEDITSVTLSQILVDTERGGRTVPGSLLTGIFQRGGETLYGVLRRGVDDASEGIGEFQRNVRKLMGADADGDGRDWIAFSPNDLDKLVQRTMERVFKALDLPRRSDIEALNQRLDSVLGALEVANEKGENAGTNTPGDRAARDPESRD
jgi:polyhydroxyalkanoate synthesis repressor PhaR